MHDDADGAAAAFNKVLSCSFYCKKKADRLSNQPESYLSIIVLYEQAFPSSYISNPKFTRLKDLSLNLPQLKCRVPNRKNKQSMNLNPVLSTARTRLELLIGVSKGGDTSMEA